MTTNQIKREETDESEADTRTLGLFLVIWISVSMAIVAIGFGIEAFVHHDAGETIQLAGLIVLVCSASICSDLLTALPRRWRHASYGSLGVTIVGLLAVLWWYAPPETFEFVLTSVAGILAVVIAGGVVMLGAAWLGENGSRIEGET